VFMFALSLGTRPPHSATWPVAFDGEKWGGCG
jgi:hypothetical protein